MHERSEHTTVPPTATRAMRTRWSGALCVVSTVRGRHSALPWRTGLVWLAYWSGVQSAMVFSGTVITVLKVLPSVSILTTSQLPATL